MIKLKASVETQKLTTYNQHDMYWDGSLLQK